MYPSLVHIAAWDMARLHFQYYGCHTSDINYRYALPLVPLVIRIKPWDNLLL